MDIQISKAILSGKVKIPASKSVSHRSIICAALSNSKSVIKNISYSDDIVATIDVMKSLGAEFELYDDYIVVKGIDGNFSKNNKSEISVGVKESGSTFRFLLPMLSMIGSEVCIKTEGKLIDRPLDVYYDVFKKNDIGYKIDGKNFIISKSTGIDSGRYSIKGNISSQFVSGLLFLLPLLKGDSILEIEGDLESKSYVDLTLDCLQKFCVKVDNIGYKKFAIKGNQRYISTDIDLEGDYSQYAFFHIANELGSKIEISGVDKNSLQGDKKVIEIVDNYKKDDNYSFDGCNVVDVVPIISLFACINCKESRIYNISRLRMKESDRIEAVCSVLRSLGADISADESSIYIRGVNNLKGGVEVDSFGDHRIAMMTAIAGSICENDIVLKNAEVVSKSYPDFWEVYSNLGGRIKTLVD